jgi:HAD superfamily hydrolase (TIGR01509 family)
MAVRWIDYQAVLFDLDGVITPTAEVHMRAWARMFNDFLRDRGIAEPYTDDDYFSYVDGRPRYDGVRAFLASRDIHLPEGTPDDAETEETVCGLGNRKNSAFARLLEEEGVAPYPGSLRLLEHLRALGVAMAVVSSSRNAPAVIAAAHVEGYFSEVMHGGIAAERGLAGKPAPDTYRAAAEDLGASVAGSVVVEDAVSGVRAGAAGNFGLVVGVDRGAGAEELTQAGAHIVVRDLEELL